MNPLYSRLFFTTVLLLTLLSSDLFAADWHVIPSAEVPVRRGQGTEYKIIAVIEDGTKVSFLDENEDWAKITNKKGRQRKRCLPSQDFWISGQWPLRLQPERGYARPGLARAAAVPQSPWRRRRQLQSSQSRQRSRRHWAQYP